MASLARHPAVVSPAPLRGRGKQFERSRRPAVCNGALPRSPRRLSRSLPCDLELTGGRCNGRGRAILPRSTAVRAALAKENTQLWAALDAAAKRLEAALAALPNDAFARLSSDLKGELKDAAFALSSGPVLLELGSGLGDLLLEMGKGMDEAKAATSADAGASLAARVVAGEVPPGSSQSAALGRRLKASGRFVKGLGPTAGKEVLELGAAMFQLGEELGRGSAEAKVNAAAVYGKRTFRVGSLAFDVTPSNAVSGAVVAALFSFAAWSLGLVINSPVIESGSYASEGATTVAQSLRLTLLLATYGSSAMSLAVGVGLLALALQLSSSSEEGPK